MPESNRKAVRNRLIEDQNVILARMEKDAKQLLSIAQYLNTRANTP
ncbi:MAG: hypothetical protein ABJM82_01080 [Shimia thalassica]